MSEEKDHIHKKFDEIVSSDELKKIAEDFQAEIQMGTKELILVQQSLADAISHVSEILIERIKDSYDFIFTADSIYHDLLASLYKISEDFNEIMMEYYGEINEDEIEWDDDEDEEDDDEEDDEGDVDGPF
jgi:hypothetical protein